MKKIKKFLLTIAMTMIFSVSAFAASGFEFILNVPLGVGIGMPSKDIKDSLALEGGVGFDAGVSAQLGYMAQVVNGFGISALFELGYAHDSYVAKFGKGVDGSYSFQIDSFQLGLLPKFNIGAFSIGIGGGVKVPLGGKMIVKDGGEKFSEKLEVFEFFFPAVIGYVKATFDYSIFFTDKLALNVGLYLGGDIAKITIFGGDPLGFNSFDIGVELGFKFGPKA